MSGSVTVAGSGLMVTLAMLGIELPITTLAESVLPSMAPSLAVTSQMTVSP